MVCRVGEALVADGEAKITDADVTIGVEEDVGGLEVAVDNAAIRTL